MEPEWVVLLCALMVGGLFLVRCVAEEREREQNKKLMAPWPKLSELFIPPDWRAYPPEGAGISRMIAYEVNEAFKSADKKNPSQNVRKGGTFNTINTDD